MKPAAAALAGLGMIALALYLNDKARISGGFMLAKLLGSPAVNMQISSAGIQALEQRETFQAYSYPDANGRSIGFGHFIKAGETFAEPMSYQDAVTLLMSDLKWAEEAVQGGVNVTITQAMYDALVSFAYNIGPGAFGGSTLLKKLNAGDYQGAEQEFARWDISQGVIDNALIARRESEANQFMSQGVPA